MEQSSNTQPDSTQKPTKGPRFRIRGSFIGVLAGALIIIALMVNSCVFSSQVGTLSVQVNTANSSLTQVEVGVYKGIASEVLTDDNPNNDPEAFCTATVDVNTVYALSDVTEQGTYTLIVKPVSTNSDGATNSAGSSDNEAASADENAQASNTATEFQSPKPQIVTLEDQDTIATFNLE